MSDFPKTGFYAKKPSERAPDFIKAGISVKVEDAIEYLTQNQNEAGYVNFDLKESQSGSFYLQLNNYKPKINDAP